MFKILNNVTNVSNVSNVSNMSNMSNIWLRSNKKIRYETIDFNFKPRHLYKLIIAEPTQFCIPKVSYSEQYESRDF